MTERKYFFYLAAGAWVKIRPIINEDDFPEDNPDDPPPLAAVHSNSSDEVVVISSEEEGFPNSRTASAPAALVYIIS
jgi:hypothetical protein